jgi:glycopeptide antibiotics resistance protein
MYLGVLAALTLGPLPRRLLDLVESAVRDVRFLDFLPLRAVEQGANVLLFIPAGFLLCLAFPRLSGWSVWGFCIMASVSVEVAQLVLPGREPSLVDVVLNGSGAGLGVLLQATVGRRETREGGRVDWK